MKIKYKLTKLQSLMHVLLKFNSKICIILISLILIITISDLILHACLLSFIKGITSNHNNSFPYSITAIYLVSIFVTILTSLSLLFYRAIYKDVGYNNRNFIVIWVFFGIFMFFIGYVLYRTIDLSNTYAYWHDQYQTLSKYKDINPDPNFLKTLHKVYNVYISYTVLFFESIIYLFAVMLSLIIIFLLTQRIYGIIYKINTNYKWNNIDLEDLEKRIKSKRYLKKYYVSHDIKDEPATNKQKWFLDKQHIKYEIDISKNDAREMIASSLKSNSNIKNKKKKTSIYQQATEKQLWFLDLHNVCYLDSISKAEAIKIISKIKEEKIESKK